MATAGGGPGGSDIYVKTAGCYNIGRYRLSSYSVTWVR
jgi:hypothetical protein